MTAFHLTILQICVTLLISALCAAATAKIACIRWGGNFWLCIVGSILSLLATTGSILWYGLGMHNIQTMFLLCVFLYAAYGDIKTHEADDFIHVIVLAVALIGRTAESIPMGMLSAVLLTVVMLLADMIAKGLGIGAADIKFTAACAFLTTFEGGLWGLGIGAFIALLFNSPFRKKEGAGEGFPMLPYLSCSYMLVFLLS